MHFSYMMIKARCNVSVDPPVQRSKYTCFDKHTFGCMHYIMDIRDNYVKKSRKNSQQFESRVNDEPKQYELERQPEKVPAAVEAPTQGPPTSPLLALPNTQSIILDKLIHLRWIMMSRFDQMDERMFDLESTTNAIRAMVRDLHIAQPPPPTSQSLIIPLFVHDAKSSCQMILFCGYYVDIFLTFLKLLTFCIY